MPDKKTVIEFVNEFYKDPEKNARIIAKSMQKTQEKIQKYFDDFLLKVIDILENTDKEKVEIKVEENWLFVSENIDKILVEVNKKWWDILNISDFEDIKNCPRNEQWFLYIHLLNLVLKLGKNK